MHTPHPNGSGRLSDVDLNALTSMRFDALAALGVRDGKYSQAYVAFINPPGAHEEIEIVGALGLEDFCSKALMDKIYLRDKAIQHQDLVDVVDDGQEMAY